MRSSRREFLFGMLAAGCSRRAFSSPLQRAVAYLWSQQAEDGGFHSSTYGLLRSGQSLTPFVLDTLLAVPETVAARPSGGADRALRFIERHVAPDGSLGSADATAADYPNYATALAVTAMARAGRPATATGAMVGYLRSQQFGEDNGWNADAPPYGAWGMGGPIHRPPDAGHVDLSMTRFVLEALRAAGAAPEDPAIRKCLVYLRRSQNADGGFYFSAVNPEINKAGEVDGGFRSYGTATADGLLCLRAAGVAEADERVVGAIGWLRKNHQPDRVPGFAGARSQWAEGLRFYYASVIARAAPDLRVDVPPQSGDGSFRNPANLVKEDDPLIATTFAIDALLRTL